MEEIDLLRDERMRQISAMLRAMSVASTPAEVMSAFARWYWSLRPIGYMVSVSTRDLPPGRYRVTRAINVEDVLAGRAVPSRHEPWRSRDLIPVHEGGAIGGWIADGRPKLIRGLRLADDPVLGDAVAPFRGALVLPLYHQGEPVYWNIQFRRDADAFDTAEIESAFMIGNLAGGNNTRLLLVQEVEALNARLRGQLEEVARVQASLLPRGKPAIPGLAIETSYIPSDQAGGDYFDFLPFDDGTWGILIADVSGHGPAAATIMAMLRGILHAYAGADRGPDAVLAYANDRLVEAGIEGTFVTAFFGVYDPRDASFRYARAGHNPPILKSGRTGSVAFLDGAGALPLGITAGAAFERERVTLAPGDTLVLYTDGITEAMSPSREMFGPARLDEALTACSGVPECVIDSVHTALFAHTGTKRHADDQTIVALRYTGPVVHVTHPSQRAVGATA